MRLALVYPEEFHSAAEDSPTMPSLRGKNPQFTADAEAIVKAIHLAEKHPAGKMTEDKSRIGELCGLLVVKILDSIHFARQQYEWEEKTVEVMRYSPDTEAYRDITVEDTLRNKMYRPCLNTSLSAPACRSSRKTRKGGGSCALSPCCGMNSIASKRIIQGIRLCGMNFVHQLTTAKTGPNGKCFTIIAETKSTNSPDVQ